jgi:hypothetical protein|tara:strand:+ start:1237 stop:2991 length:1755 start_codon:yes stop_codon:yes gene_type:complete
MIKMNKFSLITILTLLLYAVSASAAPNFNIVEDSGNATGSAGASASGSFTVNNTGTEDLTIGFSSDTLTRAGGTETLAVSSLSDLSLGNNTSPQSVTFSVSISDIQQIPGLYTGTLTATNGSLSDTVEINVNVTPTYSVSTSPSTIMNLGSVSLNTTYTQTFDITNTGNDDLTAVTFEFSDSSFNLQANKSNFVLVFNTTETIEFNVTIPSSSSTGNITLGSVTLDSAELDESLFSLESTVGGGLQIEDLDVFLTTRIQRSSDGSLKSESGNDLDVVDGKQLRFDNENAGPESELRFNFNIENIFTNDDDIDINDITVKVTIEEIDDSEDIEEESDEFDLDSGDNQDVDVIIKIPLAVDVGLYEVVIEVIGDDNDGNDHTAQINLKLDIDKEARNVIVSKATLFPVKVKCSGTSTLAATMKNIGSREENEAGIQIINSDLYINFEKQYITMEEDPFDVDNEFTKKMIINVNQDTEAGTYPIIVTSFLQEDAPWESKTVDLEVEACSGDQVVDDEEEINETEAVEVGGDQDEEITDSTEVPVLGPTTTTETSFAKPLFWTGMILLNIIIIGAIVFFVVKAVGKKQ